MANAQIPNLPAAAALNGSEQLEIVQAGTSVRTTTCQWQAPVPYPNDGKVYIWDEATLSWVRVS